MYVSYHVLPCYFPSVHHGDHRVACLLRSSVRLDVHAQLTLSATGADKEVTGQGKGANQCLGFLVSQTSSHFVGTLSFDNTLRQRTSTTHLRSRIHHITSAYSLRITRSITRCAFERMRIRCERAKPNRKC